MGGGASPRSLGWKQDRRRSEVTTVRRRTVGARTIGGRPVNGRPVIRPVLHFPATGGLGSPPHCAPWRPVVRVRGAQSACSPARVRLEYQGIPSREASRASGPRNVGQFATTRWSAATDDDHGCGPQAGSDAPPGRGRPHDRRSQIPARSRRRELGAERIAVGHGEVPACVRMQGGQREQVGEVRPNQGVDREVRMSLRIAVFSGGSRHWDRASHDLPARAETRASGAESGRPDHFRSRVSASVRLRHAVVPTRRGVDLDPDATILARVQAGDHAYRLTTLAPNAALLRQIFDRDSGPAADPVWRPRCS